jgi:plasmid stabilization system protein ParE
MSDSVKLRREAQIDLERAYNYYELERSGLGSEFLDEVEYRFVSMAASPGSYPVVYQDVREALVKRFPFAIYFRTEPEQIVVYAVYHCSRDPVRWQQRI